MSITFEEVIENELLNQAVYAGIPRKCKCGSDIVFSDSLKVAYCENENCPYKLVSRIIKMGEELGVYKMTFDGYDVPDGEVDKILGVIQRYELVSPLQFLMLPDDEGWEESKISEALKNSRNASKMVLIAKALGLPELSPLAYELFEGYKSMYDALYDYQTYKVPLIAERIGATTSESAAIAVRIYRILDAYKEELLLSESVLGKFFDSSEDSKRRLRVVIDGDNKAYINNTTLLYVLRQLLVEEVPMIYSLVDESTDIVIGDKKSQSLKVRSALKINNEFLEKGIVISKGANKGLVSKLREFTGDTSDMIVIAPIEDIIDVLKSQGES